MAATAIVALLLLHGGAALAQGTQPRVYLPDPSDEEWGFLEHAPKVDVWDPLKYIPLGPGEWFLTLSGQVRYRAEGLRVRSTAEYPGTIDNYLLQRYLFGADVRLGARVRVFAEVQSGIITGRLQSPRPTDRNTLDLHQAFAEWRRSFGSGRRMSAKIGRQELAIGSTRLISASPGLNVKRSFDGAAVVYHSASWTFAAAAARLVALRGGAFDDWSNSGLLFWGGAVSRRGLLRQRGELGAYYLGVDQALSRYAQGTGPERRHTVGMKWVTAGTRLSFNYDALFQWGTFGHVPLRAWALASETAYQLPSTPGRLRLSARADVASGDRDAGDSRLQAFNPLFPGNAYSGAVGLLGPTNLTDVTPAVSIWPRANLTLVFEAPSYWRTSTADGVYATDLRLLFRPDAGAGRYVGTNPGAVVLWQVTRHWQFHGVVTRFVAGDFLRNTAVAGGFGFYSGSFVYRF